MPRSDSLRRPGNRFLATALLASLLLASTVAAKSRPSLPCPEGRFRVEGAGLMVPAGGDMIVIDGNQLEVLSGCGPVVLSVRATRKGPQVRASWRRCRAAKGKVRLRATFSADCESLQGRVKRKARRRLAFDARRYRDLLPPPDPGDPRDPGSPGDPEDPGPGNPNPETPSTFSVISKRIFQQRGCTASACHGEALSGGLDLRPGAAYANLVDVAANNPAAAAAGAKRVVPGKAAESFLSRKLRGFLTVDEGARMPLGAQQLSVLERDLVDIWIAAGAPAEGAVQGAPNLAPEGYQPVTAPPVPPGGVQLLLDGPMLQPGQETEGCLWVRSPNAESVLISRTEVVANPGTHHVVVWRYDGAGTPPVGVWRPGDIACLNSGASLGTTGLAGAGMGNGANVGLPPGVASVLPGSTYFGLNAHYYNEFDVPIQVKVWFNFFPYEGTPEHTVEGLTSLDTTFSIDVPVFSQKIQPGLFVNTLTKPLYFLQLGGHMHKRGLRFSAWHGDGTKVFDDYEWAHPVGRPFDPPFVLEPGDSFRYECLHDNGVTRPVRRNGLGQPVNIKFGISAEDEMCILTGSFYTD